MTSPRHPDPPVADNHSERRPDRHSPSVECAKLCATFDTLGQALVATLTCATLCRPEAADLCFELEARTGGGKPGSARHVVLDLQNVQHMDSACIGMLVELLTKLQQSGGRIALVNAAHHVEYLFKLTRLDRVFPICRDVMKAIEVVERGG